MPWPASPSLVPIVLAYAIAHYFSLLVFEGQSFFMVAYTVGGLLLLLNA